MRRHALAGLLLAFGCTTPGPPPRSAPAPAQEPWRAAVDQGRLDAAEALLRQRLAAGPSGFADAVELAALRHDRVRLLSLFEDPALAGARAEPRARAALADALYWSAAPRSLALQDAVCEKGPEAARARACARAAQVRDLIAARPSLEGADADVPLLPGLPLPLVQVSVNGHKPEPFIVDTGAGSTMLNRAFCDRVGLDYPADRVQLVPRGPGESQLKLTPIVIDQLEVGRLRVRHFTANVVELPPDFKVGGILAPQDTFAGLLTELDLRANRLRVLRGKSLADWRAEVREPTAAAELLWSNGSLYARAQVERIAGWFLLDSGSSNNLITVSGAEQIGHRLKNSKPVQVIWGAGLHSVNEGFDTAIAVGGAKAQPSSISIAEREGGERFLRRGSLGMPWMRGRRMVLGPEGRVLAFTEPASGDAARPPLGR